MSGTSPVVRMGGFRARKDNVTLASTTWDNPGIVAPTNLAQNTNWSQPVDTVFRVRTLLTDTVASTKTANYTFGLQFNLAGGGYTAVTATTAVGWATSGQYADSDTIASAQITGGQNSFLTGQASEEDNVQPDAGNFTLGAGNDHTVVEWALLVDSAQVSNGQTFTLRCTGVNTNTGETIPTVTILEAQTVTGVVLAATPTLPAGQVNHALTAAVLTTTPTLPAGGVTLPVYGVALSITPTLPPGQANHTLTGAALTATPTLPAGGVAIPIGGQVLTVTPTLPAGSLRHSLTGTVLSASPVLPAGQVNHSLVAVALSAAPTLPDGQANHRLTAAALTVIPTLPVGGLTEAGSINGVALVITPALPAGQTTHTMYAAVLTTMPSLPAGSLAYSIVAVALAAFPILPAGVISTAGGQTVTGVVLTITPTLPLGVVTFIYRNWSWDAGGPEVIWRTFAPTAKWEAEPAQAR